MLAITIAWSLVRSGVSPWLAAVLAVIVLNVHAWVLAFEFAWLRRSSPGAELPRPAPSALVAAWWGEVVTGMRVFGWRQPFRSNAIPDELSDALGKRAVVLVHGFVCNRGLWNPWMHRLREAGVPYVAINLEPIFGSIERYAALIDRAVERVTAATGVTPVVVAHSMGGLAVRAWLRDPAHAARVHSVLTIATPHAGTALARFGFSKNTRQMRPGSPWLQALQRVESESPRPAFTCYFSHCDNIVFPASHAMLPGATNHHVPGIAHVHLAFHAPILDDVLSRTRA
jgi:triacylglycerol esterase/lipase EstA (alpha/beta hydrolase family)